MEEQQAKIFKPQYDGKYDEASKHRDSLKNTLVNACKNINHSYVIAVKGNYGSGKSTFLKHLRADLQKENVATVWFDAWRSDYSDDPFSSLVASFDEDVLQEYFKEEEERKNFLKKAKPIATGMTKFGLQFLIKQAAGGKAADEITEKIFENEGCAEFFSDFLKEGTLSLGDALTSQLFSYKEVQVGYVGFTKQLKEVSLALSGKTNKAGTESMQLKIVIFIDELDRCKPDYAIQVLETIKHFFDADNIIFILAICEDALKGAVSSVYHPNIGYESYINKFIDISFSLPVIPPKVYLQQLINNGYFNDLPDVMKTYLPVFFEGYKVPLRDQNRILSSLYFMYSVLVNNIKENDEDLLLLVIHVLENNLSNFPRYYDKEKFLNLLEIFAKVDTNRLLYLRAIFGYYFHHYLINNNSDSHEFLESFDVEISDAINEYYNYFQRYHRSYMGERERDEDEIKQTKDFFLLGDQNERFYHKNPMKETGLMIDEFRKINIG